MTEYKATPRAWADVYGLSGPGSPSNQCILELRARVEALEADGPAVSNDREPASVAAQPTPTSSLVERVASAIHQGMDLDLEARAAIREVAAWFRSGDAGAGSAWTVAAGVLDALLEQEAER